MTIAQITDRYLQEHKATAPLMAHQISNAVEVKVYNPSAIYRWLDGSRTPDPVLLKLLTLTASGWVLAWARECLTLASGPDNHA